MRNGTSVRFRKLYSCGHMDWQKMTLQRLRKVSFLRWKQACARAQSSKSTALAGFQPLLNPQPAQLYLTALKAGCHCLSQRTLRSLPIHLLASTGISVHSVVHKTCRVMFLNCKADKDSFLNQTRNRLFWALFSTMPQHLGSFLGLLNPILARQYIGEVIRTHQHHTHFLLLRKSK